MHDTKSVNTQHIKNLNDPFLDNGILMGIFNKMYKKVYFGPMHSEYP